MPKETGQNFLKTQLRKDIRQKRIAIETAQRERWNAQINRNLDTLIRQKSPRLVAAYLAFDGEPDLAPALTGMARLGTKLAVPVIRGDPGQKSIVMKEFSAAKDLQTNFYGIAEPVKAADIPLTDIDLVLIPLVAWDRTGNRLGMGAGYYDRLLQGVSGMDSPQRIGVGYDLQEIDSLPIDPWDIRLHGVLTESGWISCPA